jgi:hypothetical protein
MAYPGTGFVILFLKPKVFFFFFLVVVGIKLRASYTLGKQPTELHS